MPSIFPHSSAPVIAIVGRPNVGKSTLFNRLIGTRRAVVSSSKGTTRDRLYGLTQWRGKTFTIIDAGGVDLAAHGELARSVQRQVQRAFGEADGMVFLCDAREGLVPADELILASLRATGKPIVLAVNKTEDKPEAALEFHVLGLSPLVPISALHGRGIGELLDVLLERIGTHDSAAAVGALGAMSQPPTVRVAIIGRQNVGKSSLVNTLLREERVIVSDVPGTTRDAVDTYLTVSGQPVCLIDTAGLRHRRKVKDPVDFFSMSRAVEAIGRCDIALVVLDAVQGVASDDRRILARVCEAGRGLIIVVNKWDLVKQGSLRALPESVRRAVPFVTFAPVLAVSAKTGFGVPQMVTALRRVAHAMRRGLTDAECLALLKAAWQAHPAPRIRGRTIHLQEARWVPGLPARIELVTRPPGRILDSYQHYLLGRLHADTRLAGVPIAVVVQGTRSRTG